MRISHENGTKINVCESINSKFRKTFILKSTSSHVFDHFVFLEGFLPVVAVKPDVELLGDGVRGDAVRHHTHALWVGPGVVETLDTASAAEFVPGSLTFI